MVALVKEVRFGEDDIINTIRSADPSVTIHRISEMGDSRRMIEFMTRENTVEGRNMTVNNLMNTLRETHPGITVERVVNRRISALGILNGNIPTEERKEMNNKRSSYGIR